MNRFRKALRKGKGQRRVILGVFMLAALITHEGVRTTPDNAVFLKGIQSLAFLNMGFVVAAFNLRFKMMDLVVKDWFKVSELERLSDISKGCCERLTYMIIYYILTAAFMASSGFISQVGWLWGAWAMIAVGMLSAGSVMFIYILFSFENVEEVTSSLAVRKARDVEHDILFSEEEDD